MRSTALLGKPGLLTLCAAAALMVPAGCKTSTASGTAGGGGADGGTLAADGGAGGMAAAAADAGGSIARDVGQGVGTAAGDVASGVKSAGQGIADAGGAAVGAASGAATTAADAAREAAGGARSGFDSTTDGGSADGGRADSGAPDGGTGRDAGGGARLSDAQIAAVAVAANKVDIAAGQAAKRKSKNAQVKKFANDMIRDHTSANKQAQTLAQRLGLKPEENEMSRAITQGGEDNLATLKTLKGKEFDRAYAEHEVAYHQQVLGALDEKLIPNAQNADLKSLLQSVRAVVAEHLDHAQSLMESLSK